MDRNALKSNPFLRVMKEWSLRTFGCAGWPSMILAATMTGFVAGVSFADTYWPEPIGYVLSAFAVSLVLLGGGWLLGAILRRLLGYSF